MEICKISIILSYLASTYVIASIIYMLVTRTFGTPFKDALEKYPELRKIKEKSVRKRKITFYTGIGISIVLLCVFRPFHKCQR